MTETETEKIRLTRPVTYRDSARDIAYLGPATFELNDAVAQEYLESRAWEPAAAFDAGEFLDREAGAITADWGGIDGSPLANYDDKLDELRESEHANEQRRSILDVIHDREYARSEQAGSVIFQRERISDPRPIIINE